MKQLASVLAAGLVVVSCSGGTLVSASVISTANTIGTGEQRLLVELVDADLEPIVVETGDPMLTLRDENGSPLGTYTGELVWIVPDEHPAYAFYVEIPVAETFQFTVDAGEVGETPPAGFVAVDAPVQVELGDMAPPIAGGSVDGPALLVFASPRLCPSGSCQPMLDQVLAAAAVESVDYHQVEVFDNPDAESEDDLVLSGDIEVWGLPSQPWLFAIDSEGTVAALYEGAVSEGELLDVVDRLTE